MPAPLSSRPTALALAALSIALPAAAQNTPDPFPDPIPTTEGVIRVTAREFASIPDVDGVAARMMLMLDEPGTRRLFVNDMRGPVYAVSYDGRTVTKYVDVNDPAWGVQVQAMGRERGVQSFAFHPQFGQAGTPGYGKFYTWSDVANTTPAPDFRPGGGTRTHDTVLHEWTARNPAAATYDGAAPREIVRFEQPFQNHNGGRISFNPLATAGSADFGLLYVGLADGGSGGDPLNMAQNLSLPYGKLLRIDPLGRNSANGKYGIPASNPLVSDGNDQTLGEIYACGIRNSQHHAWDPTTGRMLITDIGQNTVEEISVVTAGANLGWNTWEGSYRFVSGQGVSTASPRSEAGITYPFVEYAQPDPLFTPQSAMTGLHVYRDGPVTQLRNRILFGDLPSGELFHIPADNLPNGGQSSIRRVLFNDGGQAKTLLQLVQAKNAQQGKTPATRADLRLGSGPQGQVFLLNKGDGTVRVLAP